ncbi:MAG TPA: hypothetical protein VK691_11070 [Solirubrobacteraceae bacterium]|jgi:hypothetical protein|nr:hypothetical protein [Solirubrobacteraceae bacterium]
MFSTERTTLVPTACLSLRGLVSLLGVLALATACVLATAAGAVAGRFHVYSCRTPSGAVAPTVGWSGSATGAYVYAEDKCAKGGALVAALEDDVEHEKTDIATWTFSAPAEETLAGATLWLAGDADGGLAKSGTYEFWLAGPNENEVFDECVYGGSEPCKTGKGEPDEPLASANRLEVPGSHLGSHLYANAACFATLGTCKKGEHDPNGYAAVVYLYAADLTLEQTSQPVVSDVEGELATASTLSGTADFSLHAEDGGSGVYEAVFTVDGVETGSVLLDENGGHCRNVGPAGDGLPAFLYPQPCQSSLTADIPFDTTALTDGTHHLLVTITNAAGNSTVALDRKIEVANDPKVSPPEKEPPPASGSQSGSFNGAPPANTTQHDPQSQTNPAPQQSSDNGSSASAGAALHVRWSATAHTALRDVGARASTVLGQLLAPSGAPIGGALVSVLFTPSYGGAHTVALASVHTSSLGAFRVRVPAGRPSGRLTFAYSATLDAAVPSVTAALSLSVPATLALRVTPRVAAARGRIAFAGTLHGKSLPPGGKALVLEARVPGQPWRQFQVLSTGAGGHYHASYRFRLSGPITYEFRAVSPAEADFPYAAGSSNVVAVRER